MARLRPKVLVTRRIPEPGFSILSECCEVELLEGESPPTRRRLLSGVKGKDAVLCLLSERIDQEVLDATPGLRVVSSMSVGLDHIDISAATKRGIYVTYTPGVLTEATADLTWALILGAARRITEADRFVRSRRWRIPWSPNLLLGSSVYGKTLGIVGLGRIGSAVAKRAKGFGMRILYNTRHRLPETDERELGASYTSLDDLLSSSDYITIHVPLTKESRHLIDEEKLRRMKPTAFLINTSRGPIVDEKALTQALKEGWIKGAALDVYEEEPLSRSSPLLRMNNILLTPHIGSATAESRSKMVELAATNLIEVLKGRVPPSLANPDVLEVRPLKEVRMI